LNGVSNFVQRQVTWDSSGNEFHQRSEAWLCDDASDPEVAYDEIGRNSQTRVCNEGGDVVKAHDGRCHRRVWRRGGLGVMDFGVAFFGGLPKSVCQPMPRGGMLDTIDMEIMAA